MTSATALHVRPDERGSWRVQRDGDDAPISEHTSETEAELAARRFARDLGAAEILVHDRYRRVHTIPHS